jgi:RNA polymerase sigma-70 factor (ECF subfamily)
VTDRRLQDWLRQYGQQLRQTLRRSQPNLPMADLDDLEQEVHIRLWRALGAEREIRQPASWIKQTVMSVTIDALRRANSRGDQLPREALTVLDESSAGRSSDASEEDPARWSASRQEVERIEQALVAYADETRRVVRLYLAGFSTLETARLLDWTEAKVRNLLYRTLADLRQSLNAGNIGDE